MKQGNTVGSRFKINSAYIAGFLDGDGSLMMQIKRRSDSKKGIRFMLTICFYQDSRHDTPLFWIQKELGVGYISKRNDHMTELRINGFEKVEKILLRLLPFLRFKKVQAREIIKSARILQKSRMSSGADNRKLTDSILRIQRENYATRKKKTKEEIYKILNLTP